MIDILDIKDKIKTLEAELFTNIKNRTGFITKRW